MSKISEGKLRILTEVFRQTKAPDGLQAKITADLRTHGVIRDTADEWKTLLDGCSHETAKRARFEIQVPAAAQTAQSAERFAEKPPSIPQTKAKEPPKIDEAVVNLWLDEIGVGKDPGVIALSLTQRETLARIAQRNRRWARELVISPFLEETASLSSILDSFRPLIESGINDWSGMMNEFGLFSHKKHIVANTVNTLHYAGQIAKGLTKSGNNVRIRARVTDVPWHIVSGTVDSTLQKRLRQFLGQTSRGFSSFTGAITPSIQIPGTAVIDVISLKQGQVAYGRPPARFDPEVYISQQLRIFQLIAIAKKINAQNGVRVILYGGSLYDAEWASYAQRVALTMNVPFNIFFVDAESGRTSHLFGLNGEAETVPSLPQKALHHELSPLSPPKRQAMIKDPSPQEVKGEKAQKITFAKLFTDSLTGSDKDLHDWAVRLQTARHDARLSSEIRSLISDLLGVPGASLESEAGLQRLHSVLWDELESQFSSIGEIEDRSEAIKTELSDIAPEDSEQEIRSALEKINRLESRLNGVQIAFEGMSNALSLIENAGSLIHPEKLDDVIGGTVSDALSNHFITTYLSIDGSLPELRSALAEKEAQLKAKLIHVRAEKIRSDAEETIRNAGTEIEEKRSEITAVREAIDGKLKSIGLIDTSTPNGILQYLGAIPITVSPVQLSEIKFANDSVLKRAKEKISAGTATELSAQLVNVEAEVAKLNNERNQFLRWQEEALAAVKARGMELEKSLPHAADTGLPAPLSIGEDQDERAMAIEGKGTIEFFWNRDYIDTRYRAYLEVVDRFLGAKALFINGDAYLVDAKSAREIETWRRNRFAVTKTDLMGRRYLLTPQTWGVRLAEVGDLANDHPYRQLAEIIKRSGEESFSSYYAEFITTIASYAQDEKAGTIWRLLASTLIARFDPSHETNLLFNAEIAKITIALYEMIEASPVLARHREEWYRWGGDAYLSPADFKPLSSDILERLGSMSSDEVAGAIEETGLLPKATKDREAWIENFRTGRRQSLQRVIRHRSVDRDGIRQEMKHLEHSPKPYLYVSAIIYRTDRPSLLTARFLAAETRYKEEHHKERLNTKDWSYISISFLLQYQHVLARWLSEEMDAEPDFNTKQELFDSLAGSSEFAGFSAEELAKEGRTYIERFLPAITNELTNVAHLMMGRLLRHGDDVAKVSFIKDLQKMYEETGQISKTVEDVVSSLVADGHVDASDDPDADFSEISRLQMLLYLWRFYKEMLAFEPIKNARADVLLMQFLRSIKRGGGANGANGAGGAGTLNSLGGGGLPGAPVGGSMAMGQAFISGGANFIGAPMTMPVGIVPLY